MTYKDLCKEYYNELKIIFEYLENKFLQDVAKIVVEENEVEINEQKQ